MRTPTEYEIERLFHYAVGYDPVAAKRYYEEHKKLKGRRQGLAQPVASPRQGASADPRTGKTRDQIAKDARTRQRKELTEQINKMDERFKKLTALIKDREAEEKKSNQKSEAKKERSAKEKDKPATAAEKAQAARDSKQYRDQNQQKLKNKADDKTKSGGGSKKGTGKKHSSSELRSMRTKLLGQIHVARAKLAAL